MCAKPGHEFASVGSSGVLVSLIATQGFAMLFLIPVVGFFALRNLAGASALVAGIGAGVLGLPILVGGIWLLRRVSAAGYKQGSYLTDETDSRFRVRAVIPKRRQTTRLMRWAELAVRGEAREESGTLVDAASLGSVRGGFDPIIVRPWFGCMRGRGYWATAVVMGFASAGLLLGLLSLLLGGWGGVFRATGFMGYALTGAGMVGGLVSAELIWPVYLRIVPGRLDIFRYGFLGSGKPEVETHDLKAQGVCMDFGTYTMALEPERPIGERLPKLERGKRWPYGQVLPSDFQPRYLCLAMVVGRLEIAQRVIQAARTDEATPLVSETELMG